ncbi:MAG: DUF4328 domain-containing protein [Kineosporiaceae bacterium]
MRGGEAAGAGPSTVRRAPLLVLPLPPPGRRRARGRARLAVASARLWVVAQLAVAVVQVMGCRDWARYGPDPSAPLSDYHRSALPVLVAAFLGWWCGGLWLSRLHATARLIDPGGQAAERAMAWQCWLVPAANWILPAWVVSDVARALLRRRPRGMTDEVPLVRLWWAAYLAMTATGGAAFTLTLSTPVQADLLLVLAPAQVALTLAAATVWVRLVRLLTRAHDRLVEQAGRVGGAA